jgi:hypothetical protein
MISRERRLTGAPPGTRAVSLRRNCLTTSRVIARSIAVLAVLASLVFPTASGQAGSEKWRWKIAPYLAGISLNGETGIGQLHATVDAEFSDILSNVDFAFMAYVEAMRGAWGVGLDIMYANLGAPLSNPPGNLEGTQGTYTAVLIRQISLDGIAYVGARWNSLSTEISLSGTSGSASRDKNWVDPILGGILGVPISESWLFELAGDVGGFGIGSRLSGQLWPNVFFNVAENGRLGLGWRLLYVDYEDDSGSRSFEYDILTHGPTFGFVFLLGGR